MTLAEAEKNLGTISSLPQGWRWVCLGDVARVFAGSAAPQGKGYFDANGPPFVRVSDLGKYKRTTCLVNVQDRLSRKAIDECSLVLAQKGSILFPKSGAAIGTNNRAILGIDAYIVSHLMAVEPSSETTSLWLYWVLSQLDMTDFSDNIAYPSLKQSTVQNIKIPLPPLSEQKRITSAMNEKMAAVEKARAAAEARLEAAKALPTAYLRAVFESEEAKGWQRVRLKDVCDVVNGFGFPEHLQGRTDLPYPFIKVSDMNALGAERVVTFAANTVNQEVLKLIGGRVYPCGTVIFPKVGGALLTNKKRILGTTACFDNNVMGVVPKKVASDYVFHWFQTIDLRTLSNVQALPSVKQSSVASLEFPLAPPAEQERIVAVLNERIGVAGRIVQTIQQELETINALPVALLRRAFTGGL